MIKNKKILILSIIVVLACNILPINVIAAKVSGEYSYTPYNGDVLLSNYTGNDKNVIVPSTIDGKEVTVIATDLIKNNTTVESVTIPEGVNKIEKYAFYGCPNLTTVNIPATVKYVGRDFDYNCPKLKNYIIPSNLSQMENGDWNEVCEVTVNGYYDYDIAADIVKYTNEHRVNEGKSILTVDNNLTEYAMQRAAELSLYWEHYRSTSIGVSHPENIGASGGLMSAQQAVENWKNSPMHNYQMLKDEHTAIGIGYYHSGNYSYYIQVFSSQDQMDTNIKTGQTQVVNKVIQLDSSTKYVNFTVKGISSTKTNTLNVGETLKPTSVILNNQGTDKMYMCTTIENTDITWDTSDSNVFTVANDGTITAVGKGTATLTATLGEFSTEYTVEVTQEDIAVTGINLKESTTITQGNTEKLTPTVLPSNATNKNVTWTSSNTEVATVDNTGVVTGIKKGRTVITATTEDGNFKATCNVTVQCAHNNTTKHEAIPATCMAQGNTAYTICNDCNEIISGKNETIAISDHNYGTKIERVEPIHTSTELTDGTEAHYICLVCNKIFDENKNEITQEELVIKAPSHTYGDWTVDAEKHWKECGCGNIVDEGTHTGGTATCSEKAKCSTCGIIYGDLDENNHGETEVRGAVGATTKTEGYTGDTYCTACNSLIEKGSIIPVKICKHNNTTKHEAIPATCMAEGNTEYTTCNDCNEIINGRNEVVPILDHNYGTLIEKVEPIHENNVVVDGENAHYVCSMCNKIFDENKTETTQKELVIKAPAHTYGDWIVDSEKHWKECGCGNIMDEGVHTGGKATETEKAKCEVCGISYGDFETKTEEPQMNPQEPSKVEPETNKPQEPSKAEPETNKPQEPSKAEPETNKPQEPSKAEPETNKPQKPSKVEPETNKPQEPSKAEPEMNQPQETPKDELEINQSQEPQKVEQEVSQDQNNIEKTVQKEDTNKPQTGDNRNIIMWVSIFTVSIICFILTLKWNTKSKKTKH